MNQTPRSEIEKIVTEATGQATQTMDRITSGEVNEVYDVTLNNDDRVIVRISRRVDSQELQREEWAIEQCAAVGVPVPELLLVKDLTDREEPLAFSVHRRIEGETLSTLMDTRGEAPELEQVMKQAGQLLAKVHTIKTKGFGWLDAAGVAGYATLGEFFGGVASDSHYADLANSSELDAETISGALRQLKEGERDYETFTDSCLTHADFSASNILVHKRKVSGFIDWGLASGGHPVFDLAHWDYGLAGGSSRKTTEWLREGYLEGKGLNEMEKKLMHLYQIRLALIRIEWYLSQGNQDSLKWHSKRLHAIMST